MGQEVIITSVTANTPVDIYYCDSMSASCVFVSTVSTFPYIFNVPDPYDTQDFIIKIVDTQGCVDGDTVYITPTPTPSITPSTPLTPTNTSTQTPTPTQTPTNTSTQTSTPTQTPTYSPTPSVTPVIASHLIGQNAYVTSTNVCNDTITITNYYTYISQSNLVPVIGVKVYTVSVNSVLYNVYNGNNRWIKMAFGSDYYAVQINNLGDIIDFVYCYSFSTPTPTTTNTLTPTNTQTLTPTPTRTGM